MTYSEQVFDNYLKRRKIRFESEKGYTKAQLEQLYLSNPAVSRGLGDIRAYYYPVI